MFSPAPPALAVPELVGKILAQSDGAKPPKAFESDAKEASDGVPDKVRVTAPVDAEADKLRPLEALLVARLVTPALTDGDAHWPSLRKKVLVEPVGAAMS